MLRNFFTNTLPKYGLLMLFTGSVGMCASSIRDDSLKNKLLEEMQKCTNLQKELSTKDSLAKELLEKSLSKNELLDMDNSINFINKSVKSLNNLSEKLKSVNSNSTVENVTNKVIEEINNTVSEQVKKIIDGNCVLKNFLDTFINSPSNSETNKFLGNFDFHNFLSGMSTLELGAVVHISASLFILFSLGSIISIIFGDELIKLFKLEEKYPRLARFIEIRRKFRFYYLIWNFFLIILVLFALIYVNLLVFIA